MSHTELLNLQRLEAVAAEDPELRRIAEVALKITSTRLAIRNTRYEITGALYNLDDADRKLDDLLDQAIQQKVARLYQLEVELQHGN